MSKSFRVQQLDHVELFVPDRYAAARWYEEIFGLEIVCEVEHWANDPHGPLMISSDGGNTKLALFERKPPPLRILSFIWKRGGGGNRETAGHHRVAFRVDGQGFLSFRDRAKEHSVFAEDGKPQKSLEVIDHDSAYSVYFCDPYGNRYEVTCYDYEFLKSKIFGSQK